MKDALILIDLQNDFMPGGALAVAKGDEVIEVANVLQPFFTVVVATKDWHPSNHVSFITNNPGYDYKKTTKLSDLSQMIWPVHCVQHTVGAEFHSKLDLVKYAKIVTKGTNPLIDSYSGFFDNAHLMATDLDEYLKSQQVEVLYIMGLATDYCVKNTVLDACGLGYKVYLIEDGCRGVNLQQNDSITAIFEMREAGAEVISSQELLRKFTAILLSNVA